MNDPHDRPVVPAAANLTHRDFTERAERILAFVDQLRAEYGLEEAIRMAVDRFVHGEEHPELKRLAEVIVFARKQALVQQRLDDDREQLHHGHLDHEGLVSTGHHYEMLRHDACLYNHMLRNLVETSGQYFTRDDLMGWLVTASQGRAEWAKSELTGAVSEIALHAALQGLPELRGLRYASVEEDLAGFDFVAQWKGGLLTIDAKTGFYRPLTERKHGHKHLEISVPREAIHDFWVTRKGLRLLRHEVRQALGSPEDGLKSQSFYRPLHAHQHHYRGMPA